MNVYEKDKEYLDEEEKRVIEHEQNGQQYVRNLQR